MFPLTVPATPTVVLFDACDTRGPADEARGPDHDPACARSLPVEDAGAVSGHRPVYGDHVRLPT